MDAAGRHDHARCSGATLDRCDEVVGVCDASSVAQLGPLQERLTFVPGPTTNDQAAVAGGYRLLTVRVPDRRGHCSSGTAQAVPDQAARRTAEPILRMHIIPDGSIRPPVESADTPRRPPLTMTHQHLISTGFPATTAASAVDTHRKLVGFRRGHKLPPI